MTYARVYLNIKAPDSRHETGQACMHSLILDGLPV